MPSYLSLPRASLAATVRALRNGGKTPLRRTCRGRTGRALARPTGSDATVPAAETTPAATKPHSQWPGLSRFWHASSLSSHGPLHRHPGCPRLIPSRGTAPASRQERAPAGKDELHSTEP
jgi:hypothetical protein